MLGLLTLRVVETASNAGGTTRAASALTPVVPVPVTKALLRTALRARFTFPFTAPRAGTLVARWYSLKSKKSKAVLLASGRLKAPHAWSGHHRWS